MTEPQSYAIAFSVAIIIALGMLAIAHYLNNYEWKRTMSITLASLASVMLLFSSVMLFFLVPSL